ncbi:MAG: hypothetical protein EXX96DRAFT_346110 [Benjaminiella poitrasii]|nr:MAG: hypothetical protein EXX96DRAFT_346110 [Benjaminiella poitrasii]
MSDSEDEQLIDYSQLLNKKRSKKSALKRGVKSSTSSTDQLANARQALFDCLSQTASQKNASHGHLSLQNYWTCITRVKGTHLHTIGFSHQSHITLYPEEAAFLVSRNALVVTKDTDPSQIVPFEEFCEIMCESRDGWITYDKYQVYAHLKRLGFIVMRSKPLKMTRPSPSILPQQPNPPVVSVWKLILDTIAQWIYGKSNARCVMRPLVWDYRYRDYTRIYSTLQIVPSSPWYKPFYYTPSFDWDVYRPRTTWKKKDPGLPDFQVLVRDVHKRMPSLYEQNALFSYCQRRNLDESLNVRKTELGNEAPTFITALVAEDSITFLRLIGDSLADISMEQDIERNKKNPNS